MHNQLSAFQVVIHSARNSLFSVPGQRKTAFEVLREGSETVLLV